MGVTASDLDCLHVLNQHGPATAAEPVTCWPPPVTSSPEGFYTRER